MNITKYVIAGMMVLYGSTSLMAQKVVIGNYIFPKDKATYYGELEGGKPDWSKGDVELQSSYSGDLNRAPELG